MSRTRYWWYTIVKTVAGRSLRGQISNNSDMGKIINRAVKAAYRRTGSLTDGAERVYAINSIVKERKKNAGGVALDCYICERTVNKWISEFVHLVAAEMGIYHPPQKDDN